MLCFRVALLLCCGLLFCNGCFSEQQYMVYHKIGRGGSKASIKKHGLCTLTALYEAGLYNDMPSSNPTGLSDHFNGIFFRPIAPLFGDYSNYVGYMVPPDTKCFNQEYRFYGKPHMYRASAITIQEYLERRKEAAKLREKAEVGRCVVYSPQTAEPFTVSCQDSRVCNPLYQYVPEIVIHRKCIPRNELYFFDEEGGIKSLLCSC